MLAAIHMNVIATRMLASCPPIRATLSPVALYKVMRPTSSNAAIAASKWRSTWRPRNANRRLIILAALVALVFLDRGLLAEQIEIEHRSSDRRSGRSAMAAVFDQYGH